jgi:nicotinamidase-related amidase
MKQVSDLHGNAPDDSPVVLLLIDVINDFEFEEAERLFHPALPAARQIAALKERCAIHSIPAIYVNDNFGKWRSDFRNLISHCIEDDTRGRPIVELLKPTKEDYFVLKPKLSAFFSTTLELLLKHLGARTLILCGYAGDMCVVATAMDAYLRDYRLIIPNDCVVSQDAKENEQILKYMERVLKADIRPSPEIDLGHVERAFTAQR